MKVLFLDHDGVICLRGQWGKRNSKKAKKRGDFFDPFCQKAINSINHILKETSCEIVVSSDWRLYKDLSYMQDMYLKRGVSKAPIAYTEVFSINDKDIFEETKEYKDYSQALARVREKEILNWINNNNAESWCAVDDLFMNKLKFFVHTPLCSEGVKQAGIVEKIINILNNKQDGELI